MSFWENVNYNKGYSSVSRIIDDTWAMEALRLLFPNGKQDINRDNFILFSTSGVHGTYNTIEDAERYNGEVTFLVVHPRIVSLRYGNVLPQTEDDFKLLKELRQASWDIIQRIGKD